MPQTCNRPACGREITDDEPISSLHLETNNQTGPTRDATRDLTLCQQCRNLIDELLDAPPVQ